MNEMKYIAVETITGICGEIKTPPVVRVVRFDNKYKAAACAKRWFAEAVEKERETGLCLAELDDSSPVFRVYGDLTLHVIWHGEAGNGESGQ